MLLLRFFFPEEVELTLSDPLILLVFVFCPLDSHPRPALELSHHNDDVGLGDVTIILRMLWVPWTSQFG